MSIFSNQNSSEDHNQDFNLSITDFLKQRTNLLREIQLNQERILDNYNNEWQKLDEELKDFDWDSIDTSDLD